MELHSPSFTWSTSPVPKICIIIFKNLREGMFYVTSVYELESQAMSWMLIQHFLLSMISTFYFILVFYNSWVLHILYLGTRRQMRMASAYGGSLFQWISCSIICLMLSSVTESTAVSVLAQGQLGKQML